MEDLKNIMEEDVENQLNRLLPTMEGICKCEQCKADMAAYALNRLKPNYVRTVKGEIFHRVDVSQAQNQTDILATVVNAIDVIGAKPNHDIANKVE